jgi:hypothetical protein
VDSSVYCLPADLLGEGADRVVGTVRDRAGVPGVTVAACYHASRDIYPHNPAYRVASLAPGAFYAVDPAAYPGPLRPAVSPALHYQGGSHGHHHERCLEDYGEIARFVLGLCFCGSCADQGARHDVDVPALAARCRAYLSGVFDSAPDAPSLTEACGPDIHPYLAARTATVTTLARAAADQARQAGVRLTLLDETIPMQAYATGHGFDPARELVRAELALDPRALSQAGVHLEEPLYLAEPADTSAALTWYRAQLAPDAPLSVVLRPGPPDTRTPDSLREKAQLAQSHNCAELNFYAYGLYRLQSLDQIRSALPPRGAKSPAG